MSKKSINSPKVAGGGTMYSSAVKVGDALYISGQIAYDKNDQIVGKGDMAAQTTQVFENMKALLESAGMSFDNVVKITAYLTDLANRPAFHKVRERYFTSSPLPASTLVIVKGLIDPDLLVEVEAVAVK